MTEFTWFITGSSRGFGRALAEAALRHGDRVAATARTPEQLDDLIAEYGADRVVALPLRVCPEPPISSAGGRRCAPASSSPPSTRSS